MSEPAAIIGGPVSPYVRKVMAVCDVKGVAYRIDPIIPFQGNDEFSRLSPLRRIPVLIDDQVTLSDSTVIAEYLDERHGTPGLFPDTPAARARARWVEEFADTRIGDVFIWRLFNAAVIAPSVWKLARDDDAIARVVREDLPAVMDYLETIAPPNGFVCGALAVADIAVAAHFANLRWAATGADLAAWPKTVAWVAHRGPACAGAAEPPRRTLADHAPHRAARSLRRIRHSPDGNQPRRQGVPQRAAERVTEPPRPVCRWSQSKTNRQLSGHYFARSASRPLWPIPAKAAVLGSGRQAGVGSVKTRTASASITCYPPFDNAAIRQLALSAVNQREFTETYADAKPELYCTDAGYRLKGAGISRAARSEREVT